MFNNILEYLKGLFTNETQEMIDVELKGHYNYKIKREYSSDGYDYYIKAVIEVRAKCQIGSFKFDRFVWCEADIDGGDSKVKAFERFEKISEERRRELMMKELMKKLTKEIKEDIKYSSEEDIDNLMKKIEDKPLNFTVQIEKSKLTKK